MLPVILPQFHICVLELIRPSDHEQNYKKYFHLSFVQMRKNFTKSSKIDGIEKAKWGFILMRSKIPQTWNIVKEMITNLTG